jgi:Flp pilus assembly protein TadD
MKRHVENATDQGDGDLELRGLRQRLAANPDDLNARLQLAGLYLQRGVPDLALEHYRLANAKYPSAVEVALTLAKNLRALGASEEALKTIRACSALHPEGRWELLSFEGILRDERGETTLAEASYRPLALEPAPADCYITIWVTICCYRKSQKRRPLNFAAHSSLILIRLQHVTIWERR